MKQPVYTIDEYSIGFSIASIRRQYTKKDDFVKDITAANDKMDKAKLKKVLDKIWNEAFPQKENKEKGAE